MAKSRLLTEELLASFEYSLLDDDAAFAFIYTVPHWDRDGLLSGDVSRLSPLLFTNRKKPQDMTRLYVDQWANVKLIRSYEVAGRRILHWPLFRVYNPNMLTLRERPSKYPAPPGWTRHPVGLIPDDENELIDLILQIDPRSSYRQTLETELKLKTGGTSFPYEKGHHDVSRVNHDRSRVKRAEDQQEDQDHDVVVDHHISSSTVLGMGGSKGGADDFSSLGELERHELEFLAIESANMIGVYGQWDGFDRHIEKIEDDDLIVLIKWLARYSHKTNEDLKGVVSLTAVIRKNIRDDGRPYLRKHEADWLKEILNKIRERTKRIEY